MHWNQKNFLWYIGSTKLINKFNLEKFEEIGNINTNNHSNINCIKNIKNKMFLFFPLIKPKAGP